MVEVIDRSGENASTGEWQVPLLTVEQFAEAVGLSAKTVRQKVWRREIEYIKIGRSVRFSPEMVQKLIDTGTVRVVSVEKVVITKQQDKT
jgi:excisionase family DNA binding protein